MKNLTINQSILRLNKMTIEELEFQNKKLSMHIERLKKTVRVTKGTTKSRGIKIKLLSQQIVAFNKQITSLENGITMLNGELESNRIELNKVQTKPNDELIKWRDAAIIVAGLICCPTVLVLVVVNIVFY